MNKKVKKLFMFLAVASMGVALNSCSEAEEVAKEFVGRMDITVDGQTHNISGCVFYKENGRIMMAATDSYNNVAVYIEANGSGTYDVGLGGSILEVASNIGNIGTLVQGDGNYVAYCPSRNVTDDVTVGLFGTITYTEVSANKVSGTFNVFGVKKDLTANLTATALAALFSSLGSSMNMVGSFEAIGK
ncbi:MAG: hypothetical protein LBR28_06000 [Bacteroidales bacterium]|jgi:hypothetical protein|nr:hypothetical protein [Bacteroidales bacterium]